MTFSYVSNPFPTFLESTYETFQPKHTRVLAFEPRKQFAGLIIYWGLEQRSGDLLAFSLLDEETRSQDAH